MSPRVLVLGWDGATWDVLDRLLDAGRVPHLARLLDGGARAVLRSTDPPVTPAAWTSLATGMDPGRTGVLGFRHQDLRRLSGYSPRLAGGDDLRGRTLYEHAAASGLGVALVAHPMTWPPFPLPGGALLAGWPRPETRDPPVWPPELAEPLRPWGVEQDRPSDATRTRDGARDPLRAAEELDARTMRVARRWLTERSDALTFVGLQGTDHVAHRFWGCPELDDVYARCDGWLGELQEIAPDASVVIVSDHGFGPGPTGIVHLGRALEVAGLARAAAPRPARRLAALRHALPTDRWKAVRARLPNGLRRWGFEGAGGHQAGHTRVTRVPLYEGWEGLVVQVRGRQRGGVVDPADYQRVREQARRAVLAVADEAGPVAVRVVDREEVWRGPQLSGFPDLLVELRPELTGGAAVGDGPVVEPRVRPEGEGSHRPDGIFVASGPGFAAGEVAPIPPQDVIATALAVLGLGVPETVDGRPRADLLTAEAPRPVPRRSGQRSEVPHMQDRASLEASLEALGYL